MEEASLVAEDVLPAAGDTQQVAEDSLQPAEDAEADIHVEAALVPAPGLPASALATLPVETFLTSASVWLWLALPAADAAERRRGLHPWNSGRWQWCHND